MQAQFASECPVCRGAIVPGADIEQTSFGWQHSTCDGTKALAARRASSVRGDAVAQRLMQRAEQARHAVPQESWKAKLRVKMRHVECPACGSLNLDFEACNKIRPHWKLHCRHCGTISDHSDMPVLRSRAEGRGHRC